jgi:hypothetical protein
MISSIRLKSLAGGRKGGCETEIRDRAAPEHRIVLSSSTLTRPTNLSYLRTITESGHFQITVIFFFFQISFISFHTRISFPRAQITNRSFSLSRAHNQRPCIVKNHKRTDAAILQPPFQRMNRIFKITNYYSKISKQIEKRVICAPKIREKKKKGKERTR